MRALGLEMFGSSLVEWEGFAWELVMVMLEWEMIEQVGNEWRGRIGGLLFVEGRFVLELEWRGLEWGFG